MSATAEHEQTWQRLVDEWEQMLGDDTIDSSLVVAKTAELVDHARSIGYRFIYLTDVNTRTVRWKLSPLQ
jgi:hypothetical protein